MRSVALALLLAAAFVFSAGCLEDDQAPSTEPEVAAPAINATAPAPLHWEGETMAGADPFNVVLAECSTQASACEFHDFSINGTFDLEATLAWTNPANDLDLYLYEGETLVSNEGINNIGDPPGPTSQVLVHSGLPAGDYTFRVVMWNAVNENYSLDVTFS